MAFAETHASETEVCTFVANLAAAAHDCAAVIGLPVVVDDEEVHANLKAVGHNLPIATRQQLAIEAGLHPYPANKWKYSSELHVLCTAPVDPRPQECWDEFLWLSPRQLLNRLK